MEPASGAACARAALPLHEWSSVVPLPAQPCYRRLLELLQRATAVLFENVPLPVLELLDRDELTIRQATALLSSGQSNIRFVRHGARDRV